MRIFAHVYVHGILGTAHRLRDARRDGVKRSAAAARGSWRAKLCGPLFLSLVLPLASCQAKLGTKTKSTSKGLATGGPEGGVAPDGSYLDADVSGRVFGLDEGVLSTESVTAEMLREVPVTDALVRIVGIREGSSESFRLGAVKSVDDGAYDVRLFDVSPYAAFIAFALKGDATLGQVFIPAPKDLSLAKGRVMRLQGTIRQSSSVVTSLLVKKAVALDKVTPAQVTALTQVVERQIEALGPAAARKSAADVLTILDEKKVFQDQAASALPVLATAPARAAKELESLMTAITPSAGETGRSGVPTPGPASGEMAAPGAFTMATTAGDGRVVVSWTASAHAVSYVVARGTSPGSYPVVVSAAAMSPFTDATVANGMTYYYRVTAMGTGSTPSTNESAVTPSAPPAAPSGLAAAAGNANVALTWDAVANASAYVVKRSTTSGSGYVTLTASATAAGYTDLTATNGTTFYYVVAASNVGGTGPDSAQVSATPMAPPAVPGGVAVTAGDGMVSVAWNAAAGATRYVVKRSTTSGSGYAAVSGSLATPGFTDGAVSNGTTYYYVITALNLGGGTDSPEFVATPQAAPAAFALGGASGGDGQVTVTWPPVARATSYTIKRGTMAGNYGTELSTTATSPYTDATVSNGTTYYYMVTAVGAGGATDAAAPVSATPQGPPGSFSITSALASDGQVVLRWTAAPNATSYTVSRGTTAGSYPTVLSSSATSPFPDASVANGTTYHYMVTANGPGGSTAAASEAAATPVAASGALCVLDPRDVNGDGTPNAGDIASLNSATWGDASGNGLNGTLANFNFTGASGWLGTGTVANPYRLQFDGGDDSVTQGSVTVRSLSLWFNAASNAGVRNVFVYDGGATILRINSGNLEFRYNNGATSATPVSAGAWHHAVMANDGATVRFYLDGLLVEAQSVAAYASPRSLVLGSGGWGGANFQGALGPVRVFPGNLSASEVRYWHETERLRFQADPLVTQVEQVVPPLQATAGGSAVIAGWNLANVSGVSVGGVPATAFAILSGGKLAVTLPARPAGPADLVLTSSDGNVTLSRAFLYSDLVTANLASFLDPAHADGLGHPGAGTSFPLWRSLSGNKGAGLANFAFTAFSGWAGNGTVASPYRLMFDGSDDIAVQTNVTMRSVALWFNAATAAGVRNIFVYDGGATIVRINNGNLEFRYNNGNTVSTPVSAGQWHHLAMANDGAVLSHYLDGVRIATQSVAAYASPHDLALGSGGWGAANFQGGVGPVRVYDGDLTSADVHAIHDAERPRFVADPGVPQVARILPPLSGTMGGGTITLSGWNLGHVTGVKVGGASASGVSVVSSGEITAVVPPGAAGYADVQVLTSDGNVTVTNGLLYSDLVIGNLTSYLDPANADGMGHPGTGSGSSSWQSLSGKTGGGLVNFDGTAQSNWQGAGTVADPYRLQFDGADDIVVQSSVVVRSLALWFNAATIAGVRNVFVHDAGNTILRINNGNLEFRYYGSASASTPVSPGAWHHAVMANDGATVRYYLDNLLIAAQPVAGYAAPRDLVLGSGGWGAYPFQGALGPVRVYGGDLVAGDVAALYEAERTRFMNNPGVPAVDRFLSALSPTAGGVTVTITGWNLQNVTDVTFGGVSSYAVSVVSPGKIKALVPPGSAGYVSMQVQTADGNVTLPRAVLYSDVVPTGLSLLLDPGNVDGMGHPGAGGASRTWQGLSGKMGAGLVNFDFTGTSGWLGAGSAGNPYRLRFDGNDDIVVASNVAMTSVSLWFNADTTAGARNVFVYDSGNTILRINGGNLEFRYNGSATYAVAVTAGAWHHVVMADDGATARYYLDDALVASQAVPGHSAPRDLVLGSGGWGANNFLGVMGSVRVYGGDLASSDVDALYQSEVGAH